MSAHHVHAPAKPEPLCLSESDLTVVLRGVAPYLSQKDCSAVARVSQLWRVAMRAAMPVSGKKGGLKPLTRHDFAQGCRTFSASDVWLLSAREGAQWCRLPIEVLIHVVDHVSAQTTAVLACVCSAWRRQILKQPRTRMIVQHFAAQQSRKMAARDPQRPEKISRITERLLLSGDDWTMADLRKHSVKAVLSVQNDCVITQHVLPQLVLPVEDWEFDPIHKQFERAFEFIHRHYCVLVHCAAGYSRSPTIVLAYLMKHESMTLLLALSLVLSKRQVMPNEGFMTALMTLERELFGCNSVDLTDFDFDED